MIFVMNQEATPIHNTTGQRYAISLPIVLSFEEGQLDFAFSTKNSHASFQPEQTKFSPLVQSYAH
jgi:hypothetical protein